MYFQVVGVMVLAGLILGVLGPMLISAKSTEAVIAGVVLVVVSITVLTIMMYKVLFKKERKNEEN